jgi:hypothetical protein
MYDQSEAEQCPHCEIPLEPLHQLPPSLAESEREASDWERDLPEDEDLRWYDLRHGRGVLLGVALASLVAFWFAPWVDIASPHAELKTAHSLARGRLGWLWGGAIAWFIAIALCASRRTLNQMRGVRVILVLFAAMTWAEIVTLMLLSPRTSRDVHVVYSWAWGLYLSLGLSIIGTLAALRFGAAPKPEPPPEAPPVDDGDAPHTLH